MTKPLKYDTGLLSDYFVSEHIEAFGKYRVQAQ